MNRTGLALLSLVLLVLLFLAVSRAPSPITVEDSTAFPAPSYTLPAMPTSNPIVDAEDAMTRSFDLFPPDGNPSAPVAILVERETFEKWLLYTGMSPSQATAAVNFSAPQPPTTDNVPVWIVAILGTNLTVDDVVIDPTGGSGGHDSRPVDGAYYVWGAGTGRLREVGALVTGEPHDYASIVSLPMAVSTVVAATSQPPAPLSTPVPSRTWSPGEIATAAALLTAQSQTTATP